MSRRPVVPTMIQIRAFVLEAWDGFVHPREFESTFREWLVIEGFDEVPVVWQNFRKAINERDLEINR